MTPLPYVGFGPDGKVKQKLSKNGWSSDAKPRNGTTILSATLRLIPPLRIWPGSNVNVILWNGPIKTPSRNWVGMSWSPANIALGFAIWLWLSWLPGSWLKPSGNGPSSTSLTRPCSNSLTCSYYLLFLWLTSGPCCGLLCLCLSLPLKRLSHL